CMQVLQIPCTF
nr:immunoglobulin light chain junction region [Macaca mulatta]